MIALIFLIAAPGFATGPLRSHHGACLSDTVPFKRSYFSIEATASVLSKAKITRDQGTYRLQTLLQPAYDAGINYIFNVNGQLSFSTGLHGIVAKWIYFANLPSQDLRQYNLDGASIIWDKDIWGSLRIPFLVERKFGVQKNNQTSIKAGINLRYGLMTDETVGGPSIHDSTGNISLFDGSFSGRNGGRPWITGLIAASKLFMLRNYNIISIGLQADISTTYFFKAHYEMTVPGHPVTSGAYKINGSSLGLSVQYIFTGANKKFVAKAKAIGSSKNELQNIYNRNDILKEFVFGGNHIQFNFALLSTLKARLQNTSGNYSSSTSSTPGALLGFSYGINFNNATSLIIGPDVYLAGRNFNVSFYKNDFSPPLIADYRFHGLNSYAADLIISLPVLFEKRILYSNTKYCFINAGARLNVSTGADFDIFAFFVANTNNGYYQPAQVVTYANNNAKPWISFPINVGNAWLLKNNNVIQFAVSSNISFTKYVNGTYQITIPNQPVTEGKYSSTGSYIGLTMSYVFTSTNNRIRKQLERQSIN